MFWKIWDHTSENTFMAKIENIIQRIIWSTIHINEIKKNFQNDNCDKNGKMMFWHIAKNRFGLPSVLVRDFHALWSVITIRYTAVHSVQFCQYHPQLNFLKIFFHSYWFRHKSKRITKIEIYLKSINDNAILIYYIEGGIVQIIHFL